jgi:hypothetical protein
MEKSPLFRKVNTTAHGVHHRFGGDFRDQRHTDTSEAVRHGMHGRKRRGLDYTPLFRFLLSKVGCEWSAVYAEAASRLDRSDPIFWLVAPRPEEEREYVRTGESSYFSGLRVDDNGALQMVNPQLGPGSLSPLCKCCTHTFNGVRFTRSFDPNAVLSVSAYRVA